MHLKNPECVEKEDVSTLQQECVPDPQREVCRQACDEECEEPLERDGADIKVDRVELGVHLGELVGDEVLKDKAAAGEIVYLSGIPSTP